MILWQLTYLRGDTLAISVVHRFFVVVVVVVRIKLLLKWFGWLSQLTKEANSDNSRSNLTTSARDDYDRPIQAPPTLATYQKQSMRTHGATHE